MPGFERVAWKKELSAHSFSFSLSVCVPQSFRAASFFYNLFVLAVFCQCFFLRRFLPSAHMFLTSISDSLPKLFLYSSLTCFWFASRSLCKINITSSKQLCIINASASLHSRSGACMCAHTRTRTHRVLSERYD